ncbi:hypothetical protein [Streptomyces sp. x-19]|uniref:hypothetical protein n=1 Tax=Streptomyces sp. x-19 TaxID=2789280 RepID=UPI00397FEEE0
MSSALARQNLVVAWQEVGSGPPAPQAGDTVCSIRLGRTRPYHRPSSCQFSRWRIGNVVDRYVYVMQTDSRRVGASGQDTWDGGRTNPATTVHHGVQQ